MTSKRSTLAEFLLARVAEDEVIARAAIRTTDIGEVAGWYWSNAGDAVFLDETDVCVACGPWQQGMHQPSGQHIARWNPARVLAECESKRRILEQQQSQPGGEEAPGLRLLALPYADHRDYRDEWRL